MSNSNEYNNITSHEYIMHVIGQKYNISAMRVASIIQLAHNEEQLKIEGMKPHTKVQEYVDAKVREHIIKVYGTYKEKDPMDFVEDPIGVTGIGNPELKTNEVIVADDMDDVKALEHDSLLKEINKSQLAVDNKLFIEDVDENVINIKLGKECKEMIKVKNKSINNLENESKEMKSRWKYVAKIMNTRQKRINKVKNVKNKNNNMNILTEKGGFLRASTIKEVNGTSWCLTKNKLEVTYRSVKDLWLKKKYMGIVGECGEVDDTKNLSNNSS